jgi:SAM-dependent methyltransferase
VGLKHVQKTYEELGESDPLYAVLSFREARGNRWDPEAFFERGRTEIRDALDRVESLGIEVRRERAMDFGCGVGRLTQALCEHFEQALGVDISASMVAAAKEYNRHGDRCSYRVNTSDDLAILDDAGFDFVYSNIALQHSPPEASSRYIAEFFRVLRPGGVAVFQIPSGPRHDPGSLGARWYRIKRGPLRRLWKRLRGKAPVEIHYLNRGVVEDIIAAAGGRLVDVRQEGSVRRSRVSLVYTAVRP